MGSSNSRVGRPTVNDAWKEGQDVEYSSIGIPTEQRDQLRKLKDELGFDSYALLVEELIKNTQEDL